MSESHPTHDEMILQLGHTLAQFQLIEQWMKAYIEIAFRIIRTELPARITFGFSAADYEDAALGTLLIIFRKLNSNDTLHAEIAAIKKERDFIAHRASTEISPELFGDPESNRRLLAKLSELENRANRLFHLVGDEVDRLKDYEHAKARMVRFRSEIPNENPPNKAPEPSTTSVTPRATESVSKEIPD